MFAKTEINTGRQVEFDYLKGLFIPMILLIHSFQMLGGREALVPAYQITYILATLTGAAIFIFVLGFGSVYSKRTDKELTIAGLKLILWEFVWNLCSLTIPLFLGQLIRMVMGKEPVWAETIMRAPIMLSYINVFFIAGVCYLLLVVLRKCKLPAWGYFLLTLVFFVVNPYLYMEGKTTGNAILDFILTTFVGGRGAVSLTFIALFPYALMGVGFAKVLRRTKEKGKLYAIISIPAALIVAFYLILAVLNHAELFDLYAYSDTGYNYPGTLRALANGASILLLAGVLYGLSGWIGRCKPLHNIIMHFCRNTTPYYAIHPFWYCTFLAALAYIPSSATVCTVMSVVVWALSYGTILLWEKIRQKRK